MEKATAKKSEWWVYPLSFLLPAALIAAVFARLGVYPFGELSLLVVDLDNEYIDYLAQLHEAVRSGGSFLRSWNMGMGLNLLGLIAFYVSSPLNLLVLLLPVEWITEAVFAVTVLKFGLCGFLFAVYSREVFRLPAPYTLCCSTAYALMAYNIAYSSNIMWLDGVAFLPLVLLGVERILRGGRSRLLIAALVYVFFTSYYIGYMIGLFSLLYLTAVSFARENRFRMYLSYVGRLAGSALVAAGCCAFLLLPAFLNLRDGQSQMFHVPFSFGLKHSFLELGSKLLPGVYDTLMDAGLPFVYCSVFGLLLAALYFFHRDIPLREKLIMGGLTAFLLLSFSCEFFYLAFHAFEDPTWFPARYSFVFSFLLLYLAMRVLSCPSASGNRRLFSAAGIVGLLFLAAGMQRLSFVGISVVVTGVLLAGLYALLFLLRGRGRSQAVLGALALVLVCGETFYNAQSMIGGIHEEFQYKTRESYSGYRERYAPALARLPGGGGGPYRTEIVEKRNANGAMALGYHSISHYSTTTDQSLNTLLRRMAYNTGTINEVRFAPATPLSNGLLGIRYVLSREEMGEGYALLESEGQVEIYENQAAFPLAYFVDHSALSFRAQGNDPFALQQSWVESLWREDTPVLYAPLDPGEPELVNLGLAREEGYLEMVRVDQNRPSLAAWTVTNPTGQPAYAYFPLYLRKFYKAYATVDEGSAHRVLGYRNNAVLSLGTGETVTLVLEVVDEKARMEAPLFYTLDTQTAVAVAERAAEYEMAITRFQDTRVEGTVLAPRDGLVLTSFPFDRGWTVKVDGKQADAKVFGDAFLAFPVTQGDHAVTMTYSPAGFRAGAAISLLTLLGLVLWRLLRRLPDRHEKK